MVNDTWIIRWKNYLSDSYGYGASIVFCDDSSVKYTNPFMASGSVIHTWRSRTDYRSQRIEPSLPLIDGESPYSLSLKLKDNQKEDPGIFLCVKFLDRYDNVVSSITSREMDFFFMPPIQTYSFCIELINGGDADFVFDYLLLKEISKEEFDEEQERIKEDKENIKKGKKTRRRDKKAKR